MDNKKNKIEELYKSLNYEYNLEKDFIMYNKVFPFLDFRTFLILSRYGKLGRLIKGKQIDIPEKNIFIKKDKLRNMLFIYRGVPDYPFAPKP